MILTGSEESGLRGAKAWCKAHKEDYSDVPTYIYSFDTNTVFLEFDTDTTSPDIVIPEAVQT